MREDERSVKQSDPEFKEYGVIEAAGESIGKVRPAARSPVSWPSYATARASVARSREKPLYPSPRPRCRSTSSNSRRTWGGRS